MGATSATQMQTEHPSKCLTDAKAGIYQDFSLWNEPGFLSIAIADCTLANTNHTLPNFNPALSLFPNARFYAVSGTGFANALRLLQHLPCVNGFCVPYSHSPIMMLAALELQLLHFAVTSLQLLQSHRETQQCNMARGHVCLLCSLSSLLVFAASCQKAACIV